MNIYISNSIKKINEVKSILNHIFDIVGCSYKLTNDINKANIIYSSHNPNFDNSIFLYHDPKVWNLDGSIPNFNNFCYGENDCIFKCYYVLNRLWEEKSEKDSFGVVKLADQKKLLFVKKSYIAEFVKTLKDKIVKIFKISLVPLWPNNEDFCLVITHDVDEPYANYRTKYYFDELMWKLNQRKKLVSLLKTSFKIGRSFFDNLKVDKNFGFDYWQELEKKIRASSAFYVSVITPFDEYGHSCDVPYKFDENQIKKKLDCLLSDGWEIGLHASINSHKKLERFEEEKYKLESILGEKIIGVRHHYWNLGKNILDTHSKHIKAGFKYDSSLGLNDEVGFRSGTMWPYIIFQDNNIDNDFYQIPPTIMDGNIFYHKNSIEYNFQKLYDHFEYVKKLNGCVVLDWHLEQANLNRLNYAGLVLKKFFEKKICDYNVYLTSPKGLLEWWKKRKKIILRNEKYF